MVSRKRKKRSSKKSNNGLWFLIVFLLLLLVSIFLGYYFTHHTTETNMESEQIRDSLTSPLKQNASASQTATGVLDGTWVSEYDGTMMEIRGRRFSLEFPSINHGPLIHGRLKIHDHRIVFIYQTGSTTCNGMQGTYRFEKKPKKRLLFKVITDSCKSRVERMTSAWYQL